MSITSDAKNDARNCVCALVYIGSLVCVEPPESDKFVSEDQKKISKKKKNKKEESKKKKKDKGHKNENIR